MNIDYAEANLATTATQGTGIYIATLVFHVVADFSSESGCRPG